ncbi:Nodulin-like protein, partial [Corchorus capsularis]
MWVQSCAGVGYLFGSISPVIKSVMGYNQRQIAILGVAKDLGDSIGFVAGSLFGPAIVVTALMFIIRPVGGHKQIRPSDGSSFLFTYSICLILAAYLLGVLVLEDLVGINQTLITVLGVVLIVLILIPVIIPILLVFTAKPISPPAEENLLPKSEIQEASSSEQDGNEVIILSEVEDEKPQELDSLPASERQRRISQLQAKLFQAAADGAVRVKRRRGPRRGEDFTLLQALIKADFWLMFISLVLAAGSGLTVIDNLGQICQSLGYSNTNIFVSMVSIFNFLGRVGGGYFSETIIRNYAFPRPVAMAIFQVVMAFGLLYYALGWPGQIYVTTVLTGVGYGAHWAIVPAAASELFGLKSFGALYNFLTLASPAGSLIFSEAIASGIYDYYAEKQASLR